MRFFKISLVFTALSCSLLAMPQQPKVISGKAEIKRAKDASMVIKTDKKTIIHWKNFSMDEDETVRFMQPSSQSVVLNRVIGKQQSLLLGKMEAKGKVYIINEKGVFIGRDAVINTGSFLASTLDVTNEDFLNQKEMNFKGNNINHVVNLGKITATDGDVYLLSYHLDNQGEIKTLNGTTGLAVAKEVILKPQDEEKIFVKVSPKRQISTEDEGLANTGIIEALQAELKIDGNLHRLAIRQEGKIDARGVKKKEGRIYLLSEEGEAHLIGPMSAKTSKDDGGKIQLLGKKLYVDQNCEIDVSGKNKGGEVLIGGDYQGKNPNIYNAKKTYVDATIKANAKEKGDGGRVIIWADDFTHCAGNISTRGGDNGGDGGFTEVSGKESLRMIGKVDSDAPKGKTGQLLLDPKFIVIDPNGSDTCTELDSGPPPTYGIVWGTNPDDTKYFKGSYIAGLLEDNHVKLQANSDVNIIDDIAVKDGAARNLLLEAGRSIFLAQDCRIALNGTLTIHINDEDCDNTSSRRADGIATCGVYEGSIISGLDDIIIYAGTELAEAGNITLLGEIVQNNFAYGKKVYIATPDGSAIDTTTQIFLGTRITTDHGNIVLKNAVELVGASEISASTITGGSPTTITIDGSIDGAYPLKIYAPTDNGTVSFGTGNSIGEYSPPNSITIIGSSVTSPSTVQTSGGG